MTNGLLVLSAGRPHLSTEKSWFVGRQNDLCQDILPGPATAESNAQAIWAALKAASPSAITKKSLAQLANVAAAFT